MQDLQTRFHTFSKNRVNGFARYAVEFLFPVRCAGCNLPGISGKSVLCKTCADQCIKGTEILFPRDFPDRAVFWDSLHSLAVYGELVRDMIHRYKSGKRSDLAFFFATQAVAMYHELIRKADIITTVPPSGRKMKSRMYDPAFFLAMNISRISGIPYCRLLTETPRHHEQKRLASEDRFLNSLGRFISTETSIITGARVLLIDDVVTTGATLNECARILKKKGAAHVFSLTVARVDVKNLKIARSCI